MFSASEGSNEFVTWLYGAMHHQIWLLTYKAKPQAVVKFLTRKNSNECALLQRVFENSVTGLMHGWIVT